MKYSINELNAFYKNNFSDFDKAYQCTLNNKSSLLCDYIEQVIKNIEKVNTFSWNDSISLEIKNSFSLCNSNFLAIKEDIENNFYKLEKLYKNGYDDLVELKTEIDNYQQKLDDEPNETNYQEKVTQIDGTTKTVTKSEYYTVKKEWNLECETIQESCSSIVDLIKQVIQDLKEIDGNVQTEDTLTTTDSSSLTATGKIVISEDYHYDMCDSRWGNMSMNDGGGLVSKGGCFMTAAATAISLCTGKVVTPKDTTNTAKKYNIGGVGYRNRTVCGLTTYYGLNYNVIEKSGSNFSNKIDSCLSRVQNKESTLIWQITPGTTGTYKTDNGHYLNIVDARKDENGEWEVKVWETGYANDRDTREGWHKFSEVNKAAYENWSYYEISADTIPNADKKTSIPYLSSIQSKKGVAL